jgi:hypothetical protein
LSAGHSSLSAAHPLQNLRTYDSPASQHVTQAPSAAERSDIQRNSKTFVFHEDQQRDLSEQYSTLEKFVQVWDEIADHTNRSIHPGEGIGSKYWDEHGF